MRYLAFVLFLSLTLNSFSDNKKANGFQIARDRHSVSIPVEIRNNLALVPVYINTYGPFYFILDTGVNTSILTEPVLANLIGLEFDQPIHIYGLGGEGIVEAILSKGVDISLPGIEGTNMNLIVIPEGLLNFSEIFGFQVFGILGYDFFKSFPVEINYGTERMRVYNHSNYRIGRRARVIPLQIINGKPYVEVSMIGQNGDTLTTNLLLDLGASHSIYLNRKYMSMSDRAMPSLIGTGISGNLMGKVGRIKKMIIGDLALKEPLVFYPDGEFLVFYDQEISWEGLIGGSIIKRFNIIVDYNSEQVVLKPNRHYYRRFNSGLSGIEVIARGDNLNQYIIHYVRPGSASYEAGILAGDQIVRLNNMRHHELNMEEILETISSGEGYPISMTIKRENKFLRKFFRLREDI